MNKMNNKNNPKFDSWSQVATHYYIIFSYKFKFTNYYLTMLQIIFNSQIYHLTLSTSFISISVPWVNDICLDLYFAIAIFVIKYKAITINVALHKIQNQIPYF
jgi:Na+/glutamate symporter